MYEHGFAVHFLAEAYGKVTDKALKERMKATLTKAVKVIADGQNREGGWRYQPKSRDADISVTCCQLHALAAAKRAGFDVPQATVDKGDQIRPPLPGFGPGRPVLRHAEDPEHCPCGVRIHGRRDLGSEGGWIQGRQGDPGTGHGVHSQFQIAGPLGRLFLQRALLRAPVMKAAGGKDWETWYAAARDALLDRRNKDGVWGDPKTAYFDTALALIILHSVK